MKPILEVLSHSEESSFILHKPDHPYFFTPWHFHPEYEIILITESEGTRFVGDSIESFAPGDLVFMGPKLPHVWKNNKEYYGKISKKKAKAVVLQFLGKYWETEFVNLPEMKKVKELFKNAKQGIKFTGKTRNILIKQIHLISTLKGSERLIEFFRMINIMSKTKDQEMLSSTEFTKVENFQDGEKINKVFEYVFDNFNQKIELAKIAAIANMSQTGFCRYFKKRTNKPFSRFLNEIRIGYAKRLLKEDHQKIIQICYDCGFNNLSNFNEQFKKITNITPTQYQKNFFS